MTETARFATLIKFAAFVAVMAVFSIFLFMVFGQYRTGATTGYSAIFADVSRLKSGDSVRVAGIRVGTVNAVSLRKDKKVVVKFDADPAIVLTRRNPGRCSLPQSGGGSLSRAGRRSGIDQKTACRIADPNQSYGAGAGP